MLSITKIFRFETAHRISNYNGPCSNIHGHSYELHVTVSGEPSDDTDMIIDFKHLKKLVDEEVISKMDHALVLKKGDPYLAGNSGLNVFEFETEPTAERLLLFVAAKIGKRLPPEVTLRRLRLYETSTSYAEWEQ